MRNNIRSYLNRAFELAMKNRDRRHYFIGAIGIRDDGTTVGATNISTPQRCRESHAEFRLSRKLDVGAVVYVARSSKTNTWANSRPCEGCQQALRNKGVKRVYYTIGPSEFGCIIFEELSMTKFKAEVGSLLTFIQPKATRTWDSPLFNYGRHKAVIIEHSENKPVVLLLEKRDNFCKILVHERELWVENVCIKRLLFFTGLRTMRWRKTRQC
jgi:tRNA(Arg) A34 adenosine deaminase TadA